MINYLRSKKLTDVEIKAVELFILNKTYLQISQIFNIKKDTAVNYIAKDRKKTSSVDNYALLNKIRNLRNDG